MKTARPFLTPSTVFERLVPFGILRKVRECTVLFRQGESAKELLLVLEGEIALTPDATEPTLCRVAGRGSVLGLPATLSDKSYGFTAVAVDSCQIAIVSRKRFLEALRQDPQIAMGLVQMLAEEIFEIQNIGLQFRLAQLNDLPSHDPDTTQVHGLYPRVSLRGALPRERKGQTSCHTSSQNPVSE